MNLRWLGTEEYKIKEKRAGGRWDQSRGGDVPGEVPAEQPVRLWWGA